VKKIFAIVLLLGLVFALVGCGDSDHPLVGRWEGVSLEIIFDGESEIFDDFDDTLEFFSDGTGVTTEGGRSFDFTWSAENGRLRMTENGDTEVMDYNISRSTLTMTMTDGDFTGIVTLNRVN